MGPGMFLRQSSTGVGSGCSFLVGRFVWLFRTKTLNEGLSVIGDEIRTAISLLALFSSALSLYLTRRLWLSTNRPIVVAFVDECSSGNTSAALLGPSFGGGDFLLRAATLPATSVRNLHFARASRGSSLVLPHPRPMTVRRLPHCTIAHHSLA